MRRFAVHAANALLFALAFAAGCALVVVDGQGAASTGEPWDAGVVEASSGLDCGTPNPCQLWDQALPPEAGCEAYTAPDGWPCDGGTCLNGLCQ